MFFSKKKCQNGFHRSGNKCLKNKKVNVQKESCPIDGKHECSVNDKSLRPIIARAGENHR